MKADTPITADTLAKLPYLKAFVKETFRLWPNGTEVSRYCEQVTRSPTSCPPTPSYSQDLVLSDHHIPAGTHLDLNPSVHFKDPDLFPDPEVHSPERWLGPSIHPHSLRSRHADVHGQDGLPSRTSTCFWPAWSTGSTSATPPCQRWAICMQRVS